MPKQIILSSCELEVLRGVVTGDGAEQLWELQIKDPADQTTYSLPLRDDTRRWLAGQLAGGLVLAGSDN